MTSPPPLAPQSSILWLFFSIDQRTPRPFVFLFDGSSVIEFSGLSHMRMIHSSPLFFFLLYPGRLYILLRYCDMFYIYWMLYCRRACLCVSKLYILYTFNLFLSFSKRTQTDLIYDSFIFRGSFLLHSLHIQRTNFSGGGGEHFIGLASSHTSSHIPVSFSLCTLFLFFCYPTFIFFSLVPFLFFLLINARSCSHIELACL